MIKIKLEIPNEYDKYLYKILKETKTDNNIWIILNDEIYNKNSEFLFKEDKYTDIDFRNIINKEEYYLVFANIFLCSNKNIEKENISNKDYLISISIIDSTIVEINLKNKILFKQIQENIKQNNFKNVKIFYDEENKKD